MVKPKRQLPCKVTQHKRQPPCTITKDQTAKAKQLRTQRDLCVKPGGPGGFPFIGPPNVGKTRILGNMNFKSTGEKANANRFDITMYEGVEWHPMTSLCDPDWRKANMHDDGADMVEIITTDVGMAQQAKRARTGKPYEEV